MQVVAIEKGFAGGTRRKIGDVFEIDEAKLPKGKDGKPVLPKWLKPAPNAAEARKMAQAAQKADHDKQVAGAVAASGGAAAKVKAQNLAKAAAGGDLAG